MKKKLSTLFVLIVLAFSQTLFSQTDPFEDLKPFINKTWRSIPSNPEAKNPMVDISHWELILNGKAIRIMHSINEGVYGGETIIYYDEDKEGLIFYYFTTAGFYTHGTFEYKDGVFIGHEYVTGNKDGITEVRSLSKILPDGKLESISEYFKDGKWGEGQKMLYEEYPEGKVVFK